MRKTVLFLSALMVSGSLYAQHKISLNANVQQLKLHDEPDVAAEVVKTKQSKPAKITSGTVIWSEDFGNGFPAAWKRDDKSGICPWVYSTDGSYGYYNGSSGVSAGTAIASTTASNGFLICDPDSANNATYGQPSGSTYAYLESYVITDAIDLSAYPAVVLQFEEFFRYNNGIDLLVSVSSDSINWTDFTAQGPYGNNSTSANPYEVEINISQVAGGHSKVYLKFGWSSRVYYWMIDDIKLVVPEDHDMELTNAFSTFGNYYITNSVDSLAGDAFVSIPKSQLQSLYFRGIATNNGGTDQSNVTLSVDVSSDTQTGIYSNSENEGTVAVANTATIDLASEFTPTATGTYYVSFLLSQDSTDVDPDDNLASFDFEVTDTVYARDRGALYPDSIDNTVQFGTGSFTGTTDGGWKTAVYYPVLNDVTITSVTTFLGKSCKAGTSIQGILMDADFNEIITTDIHDITSSDISKGELTMLFDETDPFAQLVAGDYILGVTDFENQDDVFLAYDNETYYVDGVNFIYIPDNAAWSYFAAESKIQPIVRMNFGLESPAAIKENEMTKSVALEQNMPNPFSASTTIRYKLDAASDDVIIDIYNALGEKVASYNEGSKIAGKYSLQIDAGDFSSGVYHYTLRSGKNTISKKMTISK